VWRAPLEGTRHRGLLLAAHAPLVSSVPRALVLVLPVRQGLSRLKLVLDNAHLVPRVLSSKALAELNASVARQASAPEPDPPFARCALLESLQPVAEACVRTVVQDLFLLLLDRLHALSVSLERLQRSLV
jgi:hypothetical protein